MTKPAAKPDLEPNEDQQSADGNTAIKPGRKSKTDDDYRKRALSLRKAAQKQIGGPLSPTVFAEWLIKTKHPDLSGPSWRHYRAAVKTLLRDDGAARPELAGEIDAAIARLDATKPAQRDNPEPQTSTLRAKRFEEEDLDRICHAALATRSIYRQPLADRLYAGCATALRPGEWKDALLQPSTWPDMKWELVVRNAKHDMVRGHGEFRTLRYADLDADLIAAITASIDGAKNAEAEGRHQQLLDGVQSLMYDLTRQLFPTRNDWPTPYTTRHEASAIWKAFYAPHDAPLEERLRGLLIVATLMGHASDVTATKSYGRPHRDEGGGGMRFPIPNADPVEVARVRRRLEARILRLNALHRAHRGLPKP